MHGNVSPIKGGTFNFYEKVRKSTQIRYLTDNPLPNPAENIDLFRCLRYNKITETLQWIPNIF